MENLVGEPPDVTAATSCRFCSTPLHQTLVDLGNMPLVNTYLRHDQLDNPETIYPLHVYVCEQCLLVQHDAEVSPGSTNPGSAARAKQATPHTTTRREILDILIARPPWRGRATPALGAPDRAA